MNQKDPATPAPAATPGTIEPVASPSGVATPPSTTSGAVEPKNQEGTVTISVKKFGELNRDSARYKSSVRRGGLKTGPNKEFIPGENDDPEIVGELNREREGHASTKVDLLKEQVTNRVNDLLSKDEFKALPEMAKNMIRKNPASLSSADNLEEAMLDIEDFLTEQVAMLPPAPAAPGQPGATPPSPGSPPAGHETPPSVDSGGAVPPTDTTLESVEGKTGSDRSRSLIRNAIKQNASGGKQTI